jgi:catechol 2,3-dioxygenase-like lactoylglutathione lyase family enzyme
VTGLFHVAIKAHDLDATRNLWLDVLGLAAIARPDLGYPDAWFGASKPAGTGISHIHAGGAVLAQPD